MTNELQLLIEALQKKCKLLDGLLADSKEQEIIAKADEFAADDFDALVEHKDQLLSEMDNLDQGFESIFARIKNELLDNKDSYKEEIASMQSLIKETVDYGAQISATEMRTKDILSNVLNRQRQSLVQRKISSKSVMDYYKTSNQLNYLEPYFMDQKQ